MATKYIGDGIAALVTGIGGTVDYGILSNVSVDTSSDSEKVQDESLDVIGMIISGENYSVSAELKLKSGGSEPSIGDVIEMPIDGANKVKFAVTGFSKKYESGKVATYSISGEYASTIVITP